MAVDFVNCDYVIRIVLSFEIEYQGWITVGSKSGRGQRGAFKTVRSFLLQHSSRRPPRVRQVVRHLVEILLDAVRRFQTAQLAQLKWCEFIKRIGFAHWVIAV